MLQTPAWIKDFWGSAQGLEQQQKPRALCTNASINHGIFSMDLSKPWDGLGWKEPQSSFPTPYHGQGQLSIIPGCSKPGRGHFRGWEATTCWECWSQQKGKWDWGLQTILQGKSPTEHSTASPSHSQGKGPCPSTAPNKPQLLQEDPALIPESQLQKIPVFIGR